MTPEEELSRARVAERIMSEPLVKETLKAIEDELHEAWLATPARDAEGRDWIWRQAVIARKFKDTLRGTIESGKLASEKIRQREQSLASRVVNSIRR